MATETRDFQLAVKALDGDSGVFTGLASTYHDLDLQGDRVVPGAFEDAIAAQGSTGGYPLLWAHDQSQPIGLGRISDSKKGLQVQGKLTLADPAAQRALEHMKAGSVRGLSIGYQIPADGVDWSKDGTRLLKKLRLHEVSLVAIPANPQAQVTAVKSLQDAQKVLRDAAASARSNPALLGQLKAFQRELHKSLDDSLCACECPECLDGDCLDCSDPDCEDPNCEANLKQAESRTETLKMLRDFSLELKSGQRRSLVT